MKISCLLTPPLPTAQPSFIAITYVADCCVIGCHYPSSCILAVVASPILINMARASPHPSPNCSPSVSVVIFLFTCRYNHLPPPSPMHCLIVVLLSSWSSIIHRPLSAVHHHVISPSATSLPQHCCHCQLKRLIVVYID